MNTLLDRENRWKLALALLFVVSNGLLFLPPGSLPRAVGALLVLLLPGLALAEALWLTGDRLQRWTMGLGLSYALMVLLGMLLHYWPGPITAAMMLAAFNLITVLALGWLAFQPAKSNSWSGPGWALVGLILIVLTGAVFRLVNVGYSEFDGDEIKAMLPAAAAIDGQPAALFEERKKGPGEILPPMLLWRLTGLMTEQTARLPFAAAGLVVIVTTYLVGREWFGPAAGLVAALLTALNGLLVAFSRIVQYQQAVLLMSLLAVLAVWRWRSDGRRVWWLLAGLFVGVGLLFHYDAVLVVPAVAYAALADGRKASLKWPDVVGSGLILAAVVALFALPYGYAAPTERTGAYLAERIGPGLLKNQLADFFHINSFYSSFYYIALVSLLALWFFGMALATLPGVRRWPAGRHGLLVAVIGGSLLITLGATPPALALLWFSAIFGGAMWAGGVTVAQRTAIIWLATTFIGYNFFVATPRTHFYTILPSLILLAALASARLWQRLGVDARWALLPATVVTLLFGSYLFHVYLRPAVQYEVDWPDSRLALFWSPFEQAPPYDAYGFIHKSGWKAIGGLYLNRQLQGDYQTNGLTEKAEWYTRHQPLGCYRQTRQFFAVAHRLIDRRQLPTYQLVGQVSLPWQKGIDIYQPEAIMQRLEVVDVAALAQQFDESAVPAAFVRPPRRQEVLQVNFADAIWLRGYRLKEHTAGPVPQFVVQLQWQAQHSVPIDADVFVHLEGVSSEDGVVAILSQSNGTPVCGERPTSSWEPGEVIDDLHVLTIPPHMPPGQYLLKTGLYLPGDNRRAPVLNDQGQPAGDAATLATITIK